ncbi:fatty aldehyde dehydrogenase Hfd1p [Trichomonascus vanleenenianus]|uniref:hexadecenal dehydrogenase n=1 Tax=Trichomonascus vanleenenianus TaxID=2268995 RepID=UPI003ECA097E
MTAAAYNEVPLNTPMEEITAKIARVKQGYRDQKMLPIEKRLDQLRNLFYGLKDCEEMLKEAVYRDFKRHPTETEFLDLGVTEAEVDNTINNLHKWVKEESTGWPGIKFATARPVVSKIPVGTVLIIAPWNYPFLLSFAPIASALAAGNTVIYKPSEVIPNTAQAITYMIEKYLDPDVIQVVNGGVPETTLVLDQPFDKILFTGSTRVGKVVAQAAAKHLTPAILELGGKSPVLVSKSANLKVTARRIVWGKFANGGQTCVAPDYVLVEKSAEADLVKHLKEAINEFYPNVSKDTEDLAHIPSDRLYQRFVDLIGNTRGNVVVGGQSDPETRYIAPTIVTNVPADDPLMDDELFGPVLPILTVDDIKEDGVQFVLENHDTPLALYVFTSDNKEAQYILDRTRSGGAIVNDVLLHAGVKTVPFGGIGESGYGAYHGKYGFEAFSHQRAVLRQPWWAEALIKLRYPPFTKSKVNQMRLTGTIKPWYDRTGPVRKSFFKRIWGAKYIWIVIAALAVAGRSIRSKL